MCAHFVSAMLRTLSQLPACCTISAPPCALPATVATRSTIPVDTPSLEAWRRARVLQVGEERLEVVLNPPTVEKVRPCGQGHHHTHTHTLPNHPAHTFAFALH